MGVVVVSNISLTGEDDGADGDSAGGAVETKLCGSGGDSEGDRRIAPVAEDGDAFSGVNTNGSIEIGAWTSEARHPVACARWVHVSGDDAIAGEDWGAVVAVINGQVDGRVCEGGIVGDIDVSAGGGGGVVVDGSTAVDANCSADGDSISIFEDEFAFLDVCEAFVCVCSSEAEFTCASFDERGGVASDVSGAGKKVFAAGGGVRDIEKCWREGGGEGNGFAAGAGGVSESDGVAVKEGIRSRGTGDEPVLS